MSSDAAAAATPHVVVTLVDPSTGEWGARVATVPSSNNAAVAGPDCYVTVSLTGLDCDALGAAGVESVARALLRANAARATVAQTIRDATYAGRRPSGIHAVLALASKCASHPGHVRQVCAAFASVLGPLLAPPGSKPGSGATGVPALHGGVVRVALPRDARCVTSPMLPAAVAAASPAPPAPHLGCASWRFKLEPTAWGDGALVGGDTDDGASQYSNARAHARSQTKGVIATVRDSELVAQLRHQKQQQQPRAS